MTEAPGWKAVVLALTEHPNARAAKRDSTFFPPVTESEVAAWEARMEVSLPATLRGYYLQSNGLEAQKGTIWPILPLAECQVVDCGCRSNVPWLKFGKTPEADYFAEIKPGSRAVYRNDGFSSEMEFYAGDLERYLRDLFHGAA